MNIFTGLANWFYNDVVLEIRDLKSMQQLAPLYDGYLPWSGASLRPTTIAYLLNEIIIHDRKVVVECGSGLSTLFIASLLKSIDRDITFYSIDHDGYWLDIVHKELNRRGVADRVQTIHAPLTQSQWCRDASYQWYDPEILDAQLQESGIDLLFVDGPPANKKGLTYARYPAVPYFQSRLGEQYKVILDDGKRRGETRIAKEWGTLLGHPFKRDRLSGNIFVANKSDGGYNI